MDSASTTTQVTNYYYLLPLPSTIADVVHLHSAWPLSFIMLLLILCSGDKSSKHVWSCDMLLLRLRSCCTIQRIGRQISASIINQLRPHPMQCLRRVNHQRLSSAMLYSGVLVCVFHGVGSTWSWAVGAGLGAECDLLWLSQNVMERTCSPAVDFYIGDMVPVRDRQDLT